MNNLRLPLVVYISGASGSGKTTLAVKIAQHLYLPHVNSDLIQHGVRVTEGLTDRKKILSTVYVPLLISMAKSNISFVADSVLYSDTSEEDIIKPLMRHARVINIHLIADKPVERFYSREHARTDKGVYLSHDELEQRAQFHEQNLSKTQAPLGLGIPQLTVITNQDYEPSFSVINQFILQNSNA